MFDALLNDLTLDKVTLDIIKRRFFDELKSAFKNQSSCLGCYNTHIYLPPKNPKESYFLAIDLGGSNLRVAICKRFKDKIDIISITKEPLDVKLMTTNVTFLFEFIAECCVSIIKKYNIQQDISVGFTFSFRVEQHSKVRSTVKQWNKGYLLAINFDPAMELERLFHLKGFEQIKVDCLINDTTATLLTNYFYDNCCDVGLILGTGSNMCLAVPKLALNDDLFDDNYEKLIFNLESGNYNVDLPRTTIDDILDKHSLNPSIQFEEKMVAGLYLGELVSLSLLEYFNEKEYVLNWEKKDYLDSETIGQFQFSSHDDIYIYFKTLLNLELSRDDIEMVQRLCRLITSRSAQIAAALVAGAITFLTSLDSKQHNIGIDGSLYRIHPGYKELFETTVCDLLSDIPFTVSFLTQDNASLIGSALVID